MDIDQIVVQTDHVLKDVGPEFVSPVCFRCDRAAVDEEGEAAYHDSPNDDGSNPVFIRGVRCFGDITSADIKQWSILTKYARPYSQFMHTHLFPRLELLRARGLD